MNKEIAETHFEEVLEANPSYEEWDKKDNVVKNWVYFSLTPQYVKHLVGKITTAVYWSALKKAFVDGSSVRLMQLSWKL